MRVLRPDAAGLDAAAALLRADQPVGMPTETVYGLAARAASPEAVARVFAAKGRPADDPLIVHALAHTDGGAATLRALDGAGIIDALALGRGWPVAAALAGAWPGPLTLVLPRGERVPPEISSGLPTVAVRCPAHPVAIALLQRVGEALVAPSANRFGRISPTEAAHVVEELGDLVPAVLDGGPCEVGVESTVVAVAGEGRAGASPGDVWVLRPGGLSLDAIAAAVRAGGGTLRDRPPEGAPRTAHQPGATDASPGLHTRHYAPSTRVVLLATATVDPRSGALRDGVAVDLPPDLQPPGRGGTIGWLCWGPAPSPEGLSGLVGAPVVPAALNAADDPSRAARGLYAALRALDAGGHRLLLIEPVPWADGLGPALADRVRRAAAR